MSTLNYFPVTTFTFLYQFPLVPRIVAICMFPFVGAVHKAGYLWPSLQQFPLVPATRKIDLCDPEFHEFILRSIETQKLGPHFGIVPEYEGFEMNKTIYLVHQPSLLSLVIGVASFPISTRTIEYFKCNKLSKSCP